MHRKNLPVAIPEIISKDTTTWIYSGSAVLDKDNTSVFGKNGAPPLVAIFTADQPKQHKESQFTGEIHGRKAVDQTGPTVKRISCETV